MNRKCHILGLTLAAVILTPALAAAQSPPKVNPPIAPKSEQLDPNACGQNRATVGEGGELNTQKAGGPHSERPACPIRRRHLPAFAGRSRHQGADPAGWLDAGDPAAGQPGRRSQCCAEVSVPEGLLPGLLDSLRPPFLYPAIPAAAGTVAG